METMIGAACIHAITYYLKISGGKAKSEIAINIRSGS